MNVIDIYECPLQCKNNVLNIVSSYPMLVLTKML